LFLLQEEVRERQIGDLSMVTYEKRQEAVKDNRIYWLDNLRTFMIFLVVLCHAGGVYEGSGGWALFWIVDDPSTNHLSDIINLILDIIMIPTIFFVSGFLAPLSLENKKGWVFLKSKFKRIMIPWTVAVLTLIPLYKVIFLYSRNLPQESWTTYFHWSAIWSQNWLWFLPVLFLFNLLYLLLSRVNCLPEKISMKYAIAAIFFIGFVNSFCMDIFGLRGWTKIGLLDFQNERLLIYFMIFLLGSLCYKLKIFASRPKDKKLYILANSVAWIPINIYIFFLLVPFIKPGSFIISPAADRLIVWLAFHLSLLCLLYLSIETFRRYLDTPRKIWNELNRNSYYVYIIHVIVIGLIALGLLNLAIPSLLKHLILTVSTYAACNLIIYSCRKAIKLKISINRMEKKMKTVMTVILAVSLLTTAGCKKQEDPTPHVNIHIAALQGNIDAMRQHINAGSDLDEKDEYGSCPLIIATTFGKTEVALVLIDAGADMKITNNEGATPLHIAAFLCRTEIVKVLLNKGADKNALNKAGKTALETVEGPFDDVKEIYDSIGKGLKQLGLRLDYERIKMTRPRIAEMLR
jgi:fucose 4-O-acetylase-like acetyltransferase